MRTLSRALATGALVTALSAVAVLPATATASTAAAPARQLKNAATGLCLAVGKSEVKKGKWPIQWTCKTIADQAWYMR